MELSGRAERVEEASEVSGVGSSTSSAELEMLEAGVLVALPEWIRSCAVVTRTCVSILEVSILIVNCGERLWASKLDLLLMFVEGS